MPRKNKNKYKLVSDWKQCWKWLSIQLSIIGIAISASWGFLTPQLQQAIPNNITAVISLTMFIFIVLGRIIDQKKDSNK